MKKILLITGLFLAVFVISTPGLAETPADRLELAKKLQELRPAKPQIDAAIEKYVRSTPPSQQNFLRTSLKETLNYKALEMVSIDAYAETYTTAELEAMIEYYSKPEAQSAQDKAGTYASKVYPHIIEMLDKALMNIKTGN